MLESLHNKLQAVTLLKKRPHHKCFPVDIPKILRTAFYRTPPFAASLTDIQKLSHRFFSFFYGCNFPF